MDEDGQATYELPAAMPGSLVKRLARVQAELTEKLPKSGYNKYHNYHYTSESDVADTLRVRLAENGVVILPHIVRRERIEAQTSQGKETAMWWVDMVLRLASEEGEYHDLPWTGVALDADDKGLAKAVTSGIKYALVKLFMLSSEEEESDSTGTETTSTGARTAPQADGSRPSQPARTGGGGGARGGRPISERQVSLIWGRGNGVGLDNDSIPTFVAGVLQREGVVFEEITNDELDAIIKAYVQYEKDGVWPQAPIPGTNGAEEAKAPPEPSGSVPPEAQQQQEAVQRAVQRYASLKAVAAQNGGTDDDVVDAMHAQGMNRQMDLVNEEDLDDTRPYDDVKVTLLRKLGAADVPV